jgi:DNA-K related protein
LLREMWRAASSLELLPVGTKTELGEALTRRVKAGDSQDSELWCLSRLGARQLFYGPINLVVPPTTVSRWIDALVKAPRAAEVVAVMAAHTGDSSRDVAPQVTELARRAIGDQPKLLAVLDGEGRDLDALGRIFGEELPSGLQLAEPT